MKLSEGVSVAEISEIIGAEYQGVQEINVTGLNEIHKVEEGDLTFVDHPKYYDRALHSAATFIIINKKVEPPVGKGVFYAEDPFRAYNMLTRKYRPFQPLDREWSLTAEVGEGTVVQPGAILGHQVKIGRDCVIHPNVVIYDNTIIGDRVVIHANSVIGAEAFYFKKRSDKISKFDKLHSCGRVVIEDDVEIGAACTIDKGVSGDTIIGMGSKLDNQVHIGHGSVLGKNCLIAAQVGVAGKVRIGDEVTLWGQVGVSKDLEIGDNAVIYAQSGVPKSLEGNKIYFGTPVEEAREKMKVIAALKHLPKMWQQWEKG